MTDILTGLSTVWQGVNLIGTGGLLATITLVTILIISLTKKTEDQLIYGLVGLSMTLFTGTVTGVNQSILMIIMVMIVIGGIFVSVNPLKQNV